MEIENMLSILIKKLVDLIEFLGVFTPEEIMYLLGLFIISLFILGNIIICVDKIFPICIKMVRVLVYGLICIIMFMTIIMLGDCLIYNDNNLNINNFKKNLWSVVNQFSLDMTAEEIITWMRTPFNDN